jgi:hypothetical protein
MMKITGSGFVQKCHGSGTLIQSTGAWFVEWRSTVPTVHINSLIWQQVQGNIYIYCSCPGTEVMLSKAIVSEPLYVDVMCYTSISR